MAEVPATHWKAQRSRAMPVYTTNVSIYISIYKQDGTYASAAGKGDTKLTSDEEAAEGNLIWRACTEEQRMTSVSGNSTLNVPRTGSESGGSGRDRVTWKRPDTEPTASAGRGNHEAMPLIRRRGTLIPHTCTPVTSNRASLPTDTTSGTSPTPQERPYDAAAPDADGLVWATVSMVINKSKRNNIVLFCVSIKKNREVRNRRVDRS